MMRRNPRLFRLTATVALSALLWDIVVQLAAVAQPAPPPLPPPGQGRPDLNQADPPARVGRIAGMTGTVSFHNEGDTEWSAASLNYPVSTGNSFWTEPSASARLEISDSPIVMGGGTEFDVTTLDGNGLQGVMRQGESYIHLRDLAPNEAWSIQTPRGLVRLSGQGRYEIVVGTTEQPTLITAIDGAAQIDGPGVSLQIAGGQTATITGADTFQGSVGPAVQDAFLTASLDAERPPAAPAVPIPNQVILMAGGSDLVGTGSWSDAPEYGQIWYPPVSADWVPYREGHWAYVSPWGWTWIDDASWGFAPFHYGRWIQIGGRWAWTPGGVAVAGPPVYAPALVSFIGIGAGVAVGAAIASGSIGWVPLGPREPFRPWYHTSPAYLRQVNVGHVSNVNNVTVNTFINRGAATSVPAAAMTGSRPIREIARPVSAQEFAAARRIVGQQPIRPTAGTAGVTPIVVRHLDLAAGGAVHNAPGPAVRPGAVGAAGFVRPAFPTAGAGPAGVEPNRPGLVQPGSRPAGVPAGELGRPLSSPLAGPGRPVTGAQPPPHAGQPATGQPGPLPGAPRPGSQFEERPVPRPQTRPEPRAVPRMPPQVTPTPRFEPQRVAPPAPLPEIQRVAPVQPHPEAPRAAPMARRPEAPRPPPMAPRPEPPRAAPMAPRPEPPRAAPPPAPRQEARSAPQEHRKAPGER